MVYSYSIKSNKKDSVNVLMIKIFEEVLEITMISLMDKFALEPTGYPWLLAPWHKNVKMSTESQHAGVSIKPKS